MRDSAGNSVGEWNWAVRDGGGTVLARISASGEPPLGVALATLRADHGFPAGQWVPDVDGYRFVPKAVERQ
ncbi:hypothetical protein C1S80_29370 [Mycolicibacterium aubagnense]|nr:hypothetical protein C1S80_29370 [Mycolicibacterium aubagnense]